MSLNLNSIVVAGPDKTQFENDLKAALNGVNSEDLIDVKYSTHGVVGMPIYFSAIILFTRWH